MELGLRGRVRLLVAVTIVTMLGLGAHALYSAYNDLMDSETSKIRQLVDAAGAVVTQDMARVEKGEISKEDAQKHALSIIKNMRYNKTEYFWVHDANSTKMIMHPIKPELDGQDLSQKTDPKGKKLFVDMNSVVKKSGEGRVDYM